MTVHLVSMGCARNEVDSEELAARLEAGGFQLVDDAEQAETVVVNTCGFIEQAKKDSVDTLLAAADLKSDGTTRSVVAVGCMAERYGKELAEALPEADAVLGFDDYQDISQRLRIILAGGSLEAHVPHDRRTLLPLSPVDRPEAAASVSVPGIHTAPDLPTEVTPASGPRAATRRRLSSSPCAPLKIASGCDRRCAFCAIPSFRGSYLSRPVEEIVAEGRWLVDHGVKELFLVSENSSSYGKDLGDLAHMEKLLAGLDRIDGLYWIRISYLQPAELRPSLIDAMLTTDKVVPYFDLSFQHASGPLLRRMRRFGDADSFLGLIEGIRERCPGAGFRSNFITGFPGETDRDVETLADFLQRARLDVAGIFAYSDEEGTEGAELSDHLDDDVIAERREMLADLIDELVSQRAEDRIGEHAPVLVEEVTPEAVVGRAPHQGPEVDGTVLLPADCGVGVGEMVEVGFIGSEGADLIGELR
ncbi:30S ribosomal protein S12 methylthiotransferase RimO [Acidipropionibacterium jensenii]|nr:30S ribosomal protein S12 methylthiotransferase RimO [Acidipropionibacterium jensenii]MDN5976144.1 30S ribosomal protein S12 methylthiotransferase RimO [Acidipropionibacterium jensenii]MDN5996459.1 30S ribosomal protein S12 methylthiotransferase RimO [Acidipropionibacterium jensenii]MDN6425938.1 30S ribosomal protein S12 methylthiotransferase RimO [Acidipropionibacterium jensenii]MDN6440773.1 30S ribosomal protein S12 methylthiotransferase RimO [Acidipropionibacterium jensenii]MDN6481500.1 